jgi:quercetin dioxygenase-like cupin family protein
MDTLLRHRLASLPSGEHYVLGPISGPFNQEGKKMGDLRIANWPVVFSIVISALGIAVNNASAQDAVKTCPNNFKVLAEDATTRVLHFTQKKGEKCAMHSHPYVVVYVIKPGKIKFVLPDGTSPKPPVNPVKAGDIVQRGPVTHEHESAEEDSEAITIEFKK